MFEVGNLATGRREVCPKLPDDLLDVAHPLLEVVEPVVAIADRRRQVVDALAEGLDVVRGSVFGPIPVSHRWRIRTGIGSGTVRTRIATGPVTEDVSDVFGPTT